MNKSVILLLGDSISLGYREYVKSNLKDSVSVVFPKEQGKSAADIYRMLYEWNRDLIRDASCVKYIYWNAGLWDVVNVFGEGENTSESVYEDYLIKTYERLRALYKNAYICFASTTPVIENRYSDDFSRKNETIEKYNAIAHKALASRVDYFDDLFCFMQGTSADDYVDATHFKSIVNKRIAAHVCERIRMVLVNDIEQYKKFKISINDKKKKVFDTLLNGSRIRVVAWGAGKIFDEYSHIFAECCEIKAVVDKDRRNQGNLFNASICISPASILDDIDMVVVTIDDAASVNDIQEDCIKRGLLCCDYKELLENIWPVIEKRILQTYSPSFIDVDPDVELKMTKYIGLTIPENTCNLDCQYCYLRTNPSRRVTNIMRKNPHDPKFIRWRLSRAVLGGSCLIGITGSGETFYGDGLEEICIELLKEGHYLHVVTNGLLVSNIENLIEHAGKYSKNIIFKLSFHYMELKKRNLLNAFINTVRIIEESPSSYSIELMPYDEIIPYIDEVITFSKKHFGALPQLTIGRTDDNKAKLLTNMSFTDYKNTFGVFESEMFDTRMKLYPKRGKACKAGVKSLFVDLYSGHINRCLFDEQIGNLYYDGIEQLDIQAVGNSCNLDYCFNCHVYATLGIVPFKNVPTYMQIRDRVKEDGKHWIKPGMRDYLNIKL